MSRKTSTSRITYLFAPIFLLLFIPHGLKAQINDSVSISLANPGSKLILGIVYKPFNYNLSIFDSDPGNYFSEPHMYTGDDRNLSKTNRLNNYSIGASLAIPINSKHFIKTGLEFSQISYYYGGEPAIMELTRYEEKFDHLLYSYVNTLGFKHIQVPLLWSYQSNFFKNKIGFAVDLGALYSYTLEFLSHSKLYWYEYLPDEIDLIKTGTLAYEILIDSKTNTFKNIRYNKNGEEIGEKHNFGKRAAKRHNLGGIGELSIFYNITSSLRLSAGVWLNIDFYPIEQRGRAGDLTPLLGDIYEMGRNIDYFYSIKSGFRISFAYLFDWRGNFQDSFLCLL